MYGKWVDERNLIKHTLHMLYRFNKISFRSLWGIDYNNMHSHKEPILSAMALENVQ